jgi:hypothetical protein
MKSRLRRVTANIRLVDKVSWLNTTLQDGPWDMYVEDLLSLLTRDSNAYLSTPTAAWNHTRHTDTRVDDYYVRYAREMDSVKRRAIAKEFTEFMEDPGKVWLDKWMTSCAPAGPPSSGPVLKR